MVIRESEREREKRARNPCFPTGGVTRIAGPKEQQGYLSLLLALSQR